MNEIRVPSKVVRYWTEFDFNPAVSSDVALPILFCGLDDGRVYQSVKVPCTPGESPDAPLANYTRQWVLHTPAIPDR